MQKAFTAAQRRLMRTWELEKAPKVQTVQAKYYDFIKADKPALTEMYLDPEQGDDANSGLGATIPLRTLRAVWDKAATNNHGTRVHIAAGVVFTPNFLRGWPHASPRAPLILQPAPGLPREAVILSGGLDVQAARNLYLLNLTILAGGQHPAHTNDVLHFAACEQIIVRGCVVTGAVGVAQEFWKSNQCRGLYIEGNTFSGQSERSGIDIMACQEVKILGNEVSGAGTYGIYTKGATAFAIIEGNYLHDCGFGIAAGEGSGLQFLQWPYASYETTGVQVTNNFLRDIPGPGLVTQGGWQVLFSRNVLWDVATAESPGYGLFCSQFAPRVYSGGNDADLNYARELLAQGAWGNLDGYANPYQIAPDDIIFANNLVSNRKGKTRWGHCTVQPGADKRLTIVGNVVWDGPVGHPIFGIARADTPELNEKKLRRDNWFNQVDPRAPGFKLPRRKTIRKFALDGDNLPPGWTLEDFKRLRLSNTIADLKNPPWGSK